MPFCKSRRMEKTVKNDFFFVDTTVSSVYNCAVHKTYARQDLRNLKDNQRQLSGQFCSPRRRHGGSQRRTQEEEEED